MCTSFTYLNNDFYFGRNLDLDCSFGEQVVITPRNFPLPFAETKTLNSHFAYIGMATIIDHMPLYAEAVNEKGLGMAGLQFTGNAVYHKAKNDKVNIASFEIIPWILGQCQHVQDAKKLLKDVNIIDTAFRPQVPNSPLHWILADKEECIVIESVKDGLKIYDNPIGVLTNNPEFPFHQMNLTQYLSLTKNYPNNRFSSNLTLSPYANGMGAFGLPGDASSPSRFVHTAFLKHNLYSDGSEKDNVHQFFRVLNQVAMIKGSVLTENNTMDYTIYSSCINASKGIYYYTTYQQPSICYVDMHRYPLDESSFFAFDLQKGDLF